MPTSGHDCSHWQTKESNRAQIHAGKSQQVCNRVECQFWDIWTHRSSGWFWPLVVGLKPESCNTLGVTCQPDDGSLILDVSCGCSLPSHCGFLTLASLRWSHPLAALSPCFSWPLPKMAPEQALSLQSVGLESLTSYYRAQHPLLRSTGAFLPGVLGSHPLSLCL